VTTSPVSVPRSRDEEPNKRLAEAKRERTLLLRLKLKRNGSSYTLLLPLRLTTRGLVLRPHNRYGLLAGGAESLTSALFKIRREQIIIQPSSASSSRHKGLVSYTKQHPGQVTKSLSPSSSSSLSASTSAVSTFCPHRQV
jgi:hypothetical protein